jgi:hypothetical protein
MGYDQVNPTNLSNIPKGQRTASFHIIEFSSASGSTWAAVKPFRGSRYDRSIINRVSRDIATAVKNKTPLDALGTEADKFFKDKRDRAVTVYLAWTPLPKCMTIQATELLWKVGFLDSLPGDDGTAPDAQVTAAPEAKK